MTNTDSNTYPLPQNTPSNFGKYAVRTWLYFIAALVFIMVIVGGITRLTDSGLSITEWQLIQGVIPPLSEASWLIEFEKYKQIPEYEQVNKGMSLDEFKTIFWWEWIHRFLGRLIGLAYLVPFAYFLFTGMIERRWVPHLVALLFLGALQGFIGWWMVTSGLADRIDVSQYRLAVHLLLACLILAYSLFLARLMYPTHRIPAEIPSQKLVAALIIVLVLVQVFAGGLVAGLRAGLSYNTWPLMDGEFAPSGLFVMSPIWLNFFENVLTVQFQHRAIAYILVLLILVHFAQCLSGATRGHLIGALILLSLATVQTFLGILTLILGVPLVLALLHQIIAMVILTVSVLHHTSIGKPINQN